MKIVSWYNKKYTDMSLGIFEHQVASMLNELNRRTEMVIYGEGYNLLDDAVEIVDMENPDVLMIWCCQTKLKNLAKVKCLKVMKCSDPWANFPYHIKFAIKNKIDLVLPIYYDAYCKYKESLSKRNIKVEPIPLWIDTNWWYDMEIPRPYDVFLTGALGGGSHPLRGVIVEQLRGDQTINKFVKGGHFLTFQEYVKTINQSKILPFGSVELPYVGHKNLIGWANGKYTEAMACGTLVMANKPTRAEELHFVPDYNFVEVNKFDFMSKLKYYLKHEDELSNIAKHGLETIQKYHSLKIRADEILKFVESF